MVSSELYLAEEDDDSASNMKEMIGGCCVCSDERGWAENPLVYCDGHGCNVAVHQGKYKRLDISKLLYFLRDGLFEAGVLLSSLLLWFEN